MRINLKIEYIEILDIRDDFIVNWDKTLYKFINNDPVIAFYIGFNIKRWFPLLECEQKYLHSKYLRHCTVDNDCYKKQIEYLIKKFPSAEEIDLIELSNYVLNNIVLKKDSDFVSVSLYLGMVVGINNTKEEELMFNVK